MTIKNTNKNTEPFICASMAIMDNGQFAFTFVSKTGETAALARPSAAAFTVGAQYVVDAKPLG